MEFTKSLIKGKLIKRYKRFFVDVKINKQIVTAHCPNTGSMKGLLDEGNEVYLLKNNNPKRRLKYGLEIIKAKKNLIVKKAKIAEILNPINKLTKLITSKELKLSISKNINAPSMVGILSKNANLDASFKLRPIRRAAVIAVPDLEAPGIKANT